MNDTDVDFKKVDLSIPEMNSGEAVQITNNNGRYILSPIQQEVENIKESIECASMDMEKLNHIYTKMIEKETHSYITTQEELSELAKNTQFDLQKTLKVNGLVKYFNNLDELIGKTVEITENNVNTNYTNEYECLKHIQKKKEQTAILNQVRPVIDKFNNQIEIEKMIKNNASTTFLEGNYIYYLQGDATNGYSIWNIPLGVAEITPMMIDGDNMVAINMLEFISRLQKNIIKYYDIKVNSRKMKQSIINELMNYPPEILEAYKEKKRFAILNPERVGLSRINNLKGLYGLTPIFKALKSQLMLETFDKVDRLNLIAKSKKIYHQILRKEVLGADLKNTKHAKEIAYAHTLLVEAMSNDTVIVTSPGYVEKIEILEPKTKETDPDTVLSYRNRVFEALGISFLSNSSKSSFNTTTINYEELLKTANKITSQLEPVINKFYKVVCKDNNIDMKYAPTISIESTQFLDTETKFKLIELLYSKIGCSYQTVFEKLGMDYSTECSRREEENKNHIDEEIFYPHCTSFTVSGKEGDTIKNNDKETNAKTEENQNDDKDKQNNDKEIYDNKK